MVSADEAWVVVDTCVGLLGDGFDRNGTEIGDKRPENGSEFEFEFGVEAA
jgi:hypothetical protein